MKPRDELNDRERPYVCPSAMRRERVTLTLLLIVLLVVLYFIVCSPTRAIGGQMQVNPPDLLKQQQREAILIGNPYDPITREQFRERAISARRIANQTNVMPAALQLRKHERARPVITTNTPVTPAQPAK